MSGSVFEWYTSNTFIDYPFDARNAGIQGLFVDAYVQHNKLTTKNSRLRLQTFDPLGVLTLRFEDGTLLAALTATDNFVSHVFGAYTVYDWRRETTFGPGFTDEDIVARVMVVTAQLPNYTFPINPVEAFLLASLVNPRINRVRRLAVAQPGIPCCTGGGFTGDKALFEEGNNVNITVDSAPTPSGLGIIGQNQTRVATKIRFDAVAGGGIGNFINCDSIAPPIKLINSVGPDTNGNFRLSGIDCTWIERRVQSVSPPIHQNTDYLATVYDALLQLHQNCGVCCSCEDFGDVYTMLARIWNQAKSIAKDIEAARKQLSALVAQIFVDKALIENGLNVKLQALARPDFFLALQGVAYNNADVPVGPITMTFTVGGNGFTYTPGSGILDAENMHKVALDPALSPAHYSVIIPSIPAAGFATYSFEGRFGPAFGNRVGAIVYPTVTLIHPPLPGVADIVSVALQGPLVKQ